MLIELVAQVPTTERSLLAIRGVGPSTADKYGKQILRLTAEAAAGGLSPAVGSTSSSQAPEPKDESAARLNTEQVAALQLAVGGENVFLTGGAGTGKSHALKAIISALHALHGRNSVYVTASTGIAACHIGGTTVHSFAGIGLGKEPVDVLHTRIMGKQSEKRWKQCSALVVDEVIYSMPRPPIRPRPPRPFANRFPSPRHLRSRPRPSPRVPLHTLILSARIPLQGVNVGRQHLRQD